MTLLAVIAVGIYFSGYADDLGRWVAKKYYRGKAQAEAEALGKVGGERAEGFLKGRFFTRLGVPSFSRVLVDAMEIGDVG